MNIYLEIIVFNINFQIFISFWIWVFKYVIDGFELVVGVFFIVVFDYGQGIRRYIVYVV